MKVERRLKKLNRERWWQAASQQPKLRTYIDIYDDRDHRGLVYANLSRRERSLIAKLRFGILPIKIETGRFNDTPLEYRLCDICSDDLLENEYHLVLYCESLKDIRSEFFGEYGWLEDVEDLTDKINFSS